MARQLESTHVKVADGSCTKSAAAWTCKVTTDRGVDVVVRETTVGGQPAYETVSGLLDGNTIASRLTSDLSRQLGKPVSVSCPGVIEANNGDRVSCKATPSGDATRTVVVKILDDRTGDYTIVPAK